MSRVIFVRYPDHQEEGPLTLKGKKQLADLAKEISFLVGVATNCMQDIGIIYEIPVYSGNTMHFFADELRKHEGVCTLYLSSHCSDELRTLEVRTGFIHAISQVHTLTLVLADAKGCHDLPELFGMLRDFPVEQRMVKTGQAVVIDTRERKSFLLSP